VFLVRLTAAEIARLQQDGVTQAGYVARRWWTLADIERTGETIWPDALPAILRRAAAGS
jgi:hypothetical protein